MYCNDNEAVKQAKTFNSDCGMHMYNGILGDVCIQPSDGHMTQFAFADEAKRSDVIRVLGCCLLLQIYLTTHAMRFVFFRT